MQPIRIGSGNIGNNIPATRELHYQNEIKRLIKLMSGSSIDDKRHATLQLSCYEPQDSAIAAPKLIELVNDNDEYTAVAALTSLGVIGSGVEIKRDDLLKIVSKLGDTKFLHPSSRYASSVAYNAAYALEKIGPNAKSVVKEIVEEVEKYLSNHEDFDLQFMKFAFIALAMIGKDAEVAKPLFIRFAEGHVKSQWDISEVIAHANLGLAMIEKNEDKAFGHLKAWVISNEDIDDYREVEKLENVGKRSKSGIVLLEKLLKEKDVNPTAKKSIRKAFKNINKPN